MLNNASIRRCHFQQLVSTDALRCICLLNIYLNTGCGGLGYDIDTVAKAMISETYKQLTSATRNRMQVSFVIRHNEQTIYNEFSGQLQLQRKYFFSAQSSHEHYGPGDCFVYVRKILFLIVTYL
jgi:hypothetical protein